jgi:hypothetical protein
MFSFADVNSTLHSSLLTTEFARLVQRLFNPPILYWNQFQLMCDCLWSIVLGVGGGMIARFAADRGCTRS